MGILSAGQQAAMGKFLAFSRTQESSADAAGATFLRKAGISGKGSIAFFQKLRKQEYRLSSSYADIDPYAQTHPMSADRAEIARGGISQARPAWDAKTDPALEARFQRIKAKLAGYRRRSDDDAAQISRRATPACRRIMRAPMPGIRAPIPTRR